MDAGMGFSRQRLVVMRVKQICQDDPRRAPPWFCNELRTLGSGQRRRIGRLLPDGTVERFESLCQAVRGRDSRGLGQFPGLYRQHGRQKLDLVRRLTL